jgi:signal transduction histidine kinase
VPSLERLWNGPPELPGTLRLEWRFVAVRWLGGALVAPALLMAHLPDERLLAAYAVLCVAGVYNLALRYLILTRPAWLGGGYVASVGDGVLALAMLQIGGGFDSPFYGVLFIVTLAAAMRYGYGLSLGITLVYVGTDALHALSQRGDLSAVLVRSLVLVITTVLAGYLRECAQHAEAALHERLRQSTALNDATAVLGASLDLEAVLSGAVAAAAQLFGSTAAVLLANDIDVDDLRVPADATVFPAGDTSARTHELARLCRAPMRADALITVERLASEDDAILMQLALPTHSRSLGTLAVAVPRGTSLTLDSDILDAFLERLTLAVENAALYHTLAARSADLQRAYADLASAHQELLSVDEMKTNFLANVSHELRTPLTSIRSFSELLLAYDENPAVSKEFLRIINTESERLTRLVNDVLDISRIEAGRMDWRMHALDVSELARECAAMFRPLMARSELHFEVTIDTLPLVLADRDRLHQVLANLLNNAMKFTRRGGRIALHAVAAADEIRISVTDTGVGIAEHDQERIFEKFQQLGDTLTDKPRGTGLGLPICRDIVRHHGGRLWVASTPGTGSTFTVALPLARAATVPLASVA